MAPPSKPTSALRFAVVGGGITGLTAAYRLSRLLPEATVELFEASGRLGGVLSTKLTDGYLVERGADSFFTKLPAALELCEELGLREELLPTNEAQRRALVVKTGKLFPVPEGFVVIRPHQINSILQTPLLSWSGKLRVLMERWVPTVADIGDEDFDESVASFARRRLGKEAFERLVQPLLAGIYTADPERLSLAATMPDAIEAERRHGSLRKATLAQAKTKRETVDSQASGARYASFVTLRGGLRQLIDALGERLGEASIFLNRPVQSLSEDECGQWNLKMAAGESVSPFDGVVVALPAARAADIVQDVDPQLGEQLGSIPYASSAIVCLAVREDQIGRRPEGFGIIVPTIEGKDIVAASFSSIKFVGRAPERHLLVRVFLGGATRPELVDLEDDELYRMAKRELAELIEIDGEPVELELVRWREKMPQYHVGHVQLIADIEKRVAELDGLELAGNAYHGVGIPQCVKSGDAAARRLASRHLKGSAELSREV